MKPSCASSVRSALRSSDRRRGAPVAKPRTSTSLSSFRNRFRVWAVLGLCPVFAIGLRSSSAARSMWLKSSLALRGCGRPLSGTGSVPTKRPRRRFQDIQDNIAAIKRYTAGLDLASYSASDLVADAVERCLLRISEAAAKLGDQAELFAPSVDWRNVRGLGNVLRHDYDGVSTKTIWAIVSQDLDVLSQACTAALAALPADMD